MKAFSVGSLFKVSSDLQKPLITIVGRTDNRGNSKGWEPAPNDLNNASPKIATNNDYTSCPSCWNDQYNVLKILDGVVHGIVILEKTILLKEKRYIPNFLMIVIHLKVIPTYATPPISLDDSLETDIFCEHVNKAVFAKLERI